MFCCAQILNKIAGISNISIHRLEGVDYRLERQYQQHQQALAFKLFVCWRHQAVRVKASDDLILPLQSVCMTLN